MGGTKRKIPMTKRETKSQRSVGFAKRRGGLFKIAAELCLLSVAVLATPPSKKLYFFSFGHSSSDTVVDAFLSGTHHCSLGSKLGLGFLLRTHYGGGPAELQRLIDRTQELRNSIAVLLETREKKPISTGILLVLDAPNLTSILVILMLLIMGFVLTASNFQIFTVAGIEEERTSRTLVDGDCVGDESGC